ncbi:MAG: trehalose-6-phosphate synthase, partial [Anaerolineae bacterium]|nr:trehalose-6-phosphate synthase [Anaerolineae bacterium]
EHAGAFYELGEHALVVSPFDIHGTARGLHEALQMPPAERHKRAEALRDQVKGADVRRWFADQVVDALRDLSSQAKKSSTPPMPSSSQSAASRTVSGVPSETTPKARQ